MFYFALLMVAVVNAQLDPVEYEGRATLNPQNATAEWRRVGGEHIEFQITAPKMDGKLGWFGFGISPSGGMTGADIAVGWIDGNGIAFLEDRHALGFFEPILDEQQDWKLEAYSDEENAVVFRISRKMLTCDDNDTPITLETTRFIYAAHPDPPVWNGKGHSLLKHVHESKGLKSVFLFEEGNVMPTDIASDEQLSTIDFAMTNTTLIAEDTIYWNEMLRFPMDGSSEGLHMIGYEAIITPGNEDIVHHMDLYLCTPPVNETYPVLRSFNSFTDQEGSQNYCANMFASWSKGGGPIFFPPDVAYSIDTNLAEGGWTMLQVHYDNPQLESGRLDRSGIRVIMTNKTRTHKAASTRFGSGALDWTMAIPGLHDKWVVSTECTSSCLSRKLTEDGINLVMAGPHTHLLGTKITARHVRDGKEIEPLIKDENFDFNYQQFRSYKTPKVILPGDTVVTECVYSSKFPTRRENLTIGGFRTKEEMCMVFAFYYPARDMIVCQSRPDPVALAKVYGWEGNTTVADYPKITEFIHNYNWSAENREKIENFTRFGPQITGCHGSNRSDSNSVGYIPSIITFEPYVDPELVCTEPTDAPLTTPVGVAETDNLTTIPTPAFSENVTTTLVSRTTIPPVADTTGPNGFAARTEVFVCSVLLSVLLTHFALTI